MTLAKFFLAPIVCLGTALPALSADFSDPTWPCIQRKVERLSPGLMWVHPIPEAAHDNAETRREIEDLAERLALRKIELEELEGEVADFAAAHEGEPEILGRVFQKVFDSLNTRRTRIIEGIGEFSLSQIALTEKIENARQEMSAEMKKESPDFDRVDALEEQLDWDQLIYSDRQQSITYLCETPVLLERRLFGVAQMLQAHVEDQN